MARTRVDLAGLVVLAFLLLWPPVVHAQQASGISGLVRDAAGTPVAGVTVEVASPALIERVRTVVSDAQGQYQFTNLPPGTYSVTFRATGFSTLRTEGVELPASFTAAVNGALKAGNPTETITVTGAVSQVDTRTAATQSIVSAEQSRERASGTGAAQAATSVAQAVVNPTVDVGGAAGSYASTGNGLTVRGKVGVKRLFDGLRIENMEGLGSTSYMPNTATIDQTVLELGGGTAESPAAGGFINYVPVSGSNTFRFRASGLFSNESMQGDNLNQELKDKGLTAVQKVGKIYDITGSAGGPLVKDQLWFFFAPKRWGNQNYAAGIFWNDTQGTGYYTPADGQVATYGPLAGTGGRTVRRADQYEISTSYPVRLTWQMNAKNKFNAFVDWPEAACTCRGLPVTTSPEAIGNYIFGRKGHLWQEGLFQGSWTSPLTAKLLLEAGYSYAQGGFPQVHQQQDPRDDSPNAAYVVGVHDISVQDLGLGFSYNDQITAHSGTRFVPWNTSDRMVQRFAASYVTGAHNIKAGISVEEGFSERYKFVNTIDGGINDGATVTYQFRSASFANPVPSRVIEWATPYLEQARIKADLNVFVQDRWTIKRLTLNYGLRFSYFNAGIPAQHADASPLVPFARDFAAVSCVPCWKDIDPRVGGAYDLFGNGKTAIKGSFGRYVAQQVIVIASANNPFNTSVNSVFRSWNDANGNFAPDCTLTVQSANGECGAISNANFGLANPNATTYSPNVINGWGKRDYIWDSALEVQHQLTRNVTMSGGYYRNSYGNFSVTQNQYFDPVQGRPINSSDYLPYNVIVPTDSRLPAGVSGQPLVGMYDVNAPLFGKVINVIKQADEIGQQSFVNNFIGFAMNGRFAKGIRLGGSLDTGRTTSDRCFVIDSPQDTKFSTQYLNGNSPILGVGAVSAANPTYCHEVIPFSGNLVFRMNGTYPLPRGFAVSGNYSNTPGVMELAVWNVPQSSITGLGRAPSACTTNTSPNCIVGTVPLIEPGTVYEARRNQLDLRLNKTIQLTRKALFTFNVGVYNVLNKNDVISIQTTYGPQWLKPTRVMDARLLQLSARLDF